MSVESTIEELIEQLHHPRDWRVRHDAVKHLGAFKTTEAMTAIVEALYDESPHVVQTTTHELVAFGENAVPELLKALYSKDEIAARPFIIHALRKLNDKELIPHFIHFLGDEEAGMRYAAAVALKKMPDQRAVQPLLDALQENASSRAQMLEALDAIGDPKVVSHVGAFLYDDDYVVCRRTAILLGHSSIPEAQIMLLEASLDEREDVRRAATEGLGIFNSDDTYQRIVEMLNDSDSMVRTQAIMALGGTHREEAVPLLLSQLREDDSRKYPYLRTALGNTGDLQVVFPLLEGFRKDHDHDGRGLSRLAEVVWQYRSSANEVVPSIIKAMNSEDVRLQICATWVFHSISFKYAPQTETIWVNAQLAHLDTFASQLDDQNADVRLATLVCLSREALLKLVDKIIYCLDDDDLLIQEMATQALGFINTPKSFDALRRLVNRTNDKVRRQSVNSLVLFSGEEVGTVLLPLLEHEDKWTRRLAARGLGLLKHRNAVPHLIEKLHSETDPTVKSAIIWALGDIGDPVAVQEEIRILDAEDNGVFAHSPFDSALYALQVNNNEDALAALYQVVNEGSRWQRRMQAVEAISRIGSDREIADRLFDLLEHKNETVRTTASKELGYLGSRTTDLDIRDFIVSNLINRLRDAGAGYHWSPTVAHMAAKSLYYVGTTEAIQALKVWKQERENNEDNE
ncbi:MAG: HEAT repeat domain-containing protein [Aggregatilineales bacterium]